MLGNLEFRTETYHNVLVRKNLIITIQLSQSHLSTHFRNETDAERFVHIIPNRKVSPIQSRKAASQLMPIIPVYI